MEPKFWGTDIGAGLTAMYASLGELVRLHGATQSASQTDDLTVREGLLTGLGSIKAEQSKKFNFSGALDEAVATMVGITLVATTPKAEVLAGQASIATSAVTGTSVQGVDDVYGEFKSEVTDWTERQQSYAASQLAEKKSQVDGIKGAITSLNSALEGRNLEAATNALQSLYEQANVGNTIRVRGVYEALNALESVAAKASKAGFNAEIARELAATGKKAVCVAYVVPPSEAEAMETLPAAVLAESMLYDKTKSFRQ